MPNSSWKLLTCQLLMSIWYQTATCFDFSIRDVAVASNSTSAAPKLVFAHFIVGLTINYTATDWETQIALAATHNIDAFALNVGLPQGWQLDQVKSAYQIAPQITTASGAPFKLFLSLDMSVIQSAQDVTTWVTTFCPLSAQLLINSRPLISTFSGEANLLGGQNLSAGWSAAIKAPLAALNPPLDALFIPVWSSLDPTTAVSKNPVVDGIMTWLSWPTGQEQITTTADVQFQTNAKASQKFYMAGVSPAFFTHYSDKNYIFRSDDNLYITRWKELIQMETQPDFIEIISWNDYGESHYIAPASGTPPPQTTWLDGFDHSEWLNMSDYFIQWYKTGTPPVIKDDVVYFNYRPHSISAVASSDPLPRPTNASLSSDAVYAAGFFTPTTNARQVRISVGGKQQTFGNLSSGGVSTFVAPWSDQGGDVEVAILDEQGKELMKKQGSTPINNNIKTYNFNYAVGTLSQASKSPASSLRPAIILLNLPSIFQITSSLYINAASIVGIFVTLSTVLL